MEVCISMGLMGLMAPPFLSFFAVKCPVEQFCLFACLCEEL